MKLKICGVTDAATYAMLEAQGVDWIGLWFRMPEGKHTLDAATLQRVLQGWSRRPTGMGAQTGTQPVLVTLTAEPEWLWPVLDAHGLTQVQLHGFQLPRSVQRLKQGRSDLRLFKTLHVQAGICLEERLIDGYLEAGVDAFILDTFASREQVGSTGIRYEMEILARLCERYSQAQWLCAGGVTAGYLTELSQQLPMLSGVDVDSAARVAGQIDAQAVAHLRTALDCVAHKQAA